MVRSQSSGMGNVVSIQTPPPPRPACLRAGAAAQQASKLILYYGLVGCSSTGRGPTGCSVAGSTCAAGRAPSRSAAGQPASLPACPRSSRPVSTCSPEGLRSSRPTPPGPTSTRNSSVLARSLKQMRSACELLALRALSTPPPGPPAGAPLPGAPAEPPPCTRPAAAGRRTAVLRSLRLRSKCGPGAPSPAPSPEGHKRVRGPPSHLPSPGRAAPGSWAWERCCSAASCAERQRAEQGAGLAASGCTAG